MTADEIREKFLRFFEAKGHKRLPSALLASENDPTVLFTTAGMHPLVPYLLGEKHPMGPRLCNSQKCVRTNDIDEVGDNRHLTFFEMLGNWSLGDYFKKEAIEWSFEFLTKELKIPIEKLAISVFAGEAENNIPRDDEAAQIWQGLGIKKERIAYLGRDDNWWGPAGKTGPCGPDTEMFYWASKEKAPDVFDPKDERWVEIWNDVFMQHNKTSDGKFEELSQKNVDTGMGLERITAVLQGKDNVFETELFEPIINNCKLQVANCKYKSQISNIEKERAERIIADHIKASVFMLAEKLTPSNTERGYVLRRLIRRAVRYGKLLGIEKDFCADLAKEVIKIYENTYPELKENQSFIFDELKKEEERFSKCLEKGLKELERIVKIKNDYEKEHPYLHFERDDFGSKSEDYLNLISGKDAFNLYQNFGFPLEMIKEELANYGMGFHQKEFEEIQKEFEQELQKHQDLSRTASAGQFKSGLADNSEQTTRYHTATHLLLAALKQVLGQGIEQRGSNITAERLRFDFSFGRKMSGEEIKNVENVVNQRIQENLPVVCEEKDTARALDEGATGVFGAKYGQRVKVYTIGGNENVCSKEICAGPHVSNTGELGRFKIIKEEASSSGVRRIKATLE